MREISQQFWKGRRVFVTGHMGFKGAWLCALLSRLEAITIGYGNDDRQPLLYRDLSLNHHVSITGDINDSRMLIDAVERSGAEVLIHFAAQPLVLASYEDPIGTFETNVLGTAKVLDAARNGGDLMAIIAITTDKVYQNNEWTWAYRENDKLGSGDPYSASKSAAEIIVSSMSKSFFSAPGSPRVVTARAGNVIGGGDWAGHRLLPDAARALARGEKFVCRNPNSVRPWQHVLDPLVGYLLLAETLCTSEGELPTAWNFGPSHDDTLTVREVADIFVSTWSSKETWVSSQDQTAIKEAVHLAIDSSLARSRLGWRPRWNGKEAVARTAHWYHLHSAGQSLQALVDRDISEYLMKGVS